MKTDLRETFSAKFIFMQRSHKKSRKTAILNSCKNSLAGRRLTKNLHLGISFDAKSEFGIQLVSSSTVTTSLVLMSRADFENCYYNLHSTMVFLKTQNDWPTDCESNFCQ